MRGFSLLSITNTLGHFSDKVILPVYLEPSEIPARLKYQLTGIQHLEVYEYEFDVLTSQLYFKKLLAPKRKQVF